MPEAYTKTCGHTPITHEFYFDGKFYGTCCRCHVIVFGEPPADWHDGCIDAWNDPARKSRRKRMTIEEFTK